jgi:hypothetical protein
MSGQGSDEIELREVDNEAEEDDELLKEYGEDGLEDDDVPAPATATSSSSSSSSSTSTYRAGPKQPLPRSKHRPGDDIGGGSFLNPKVMMVLFVVFLISAIVSVAFKEDLFFNAEENSAIQSDDIKINGLKETLKYNQDKMSQLAMTMADKTAEIKRLTTLLKTKKRGKKKKRHLR